MTIRYFIFITFFTFSAVLGMEDNQKSSTSFSFKNGEKGQYDNTTLKNIDLFRLKNKFEDKTEKKQKTNETDQLSSLFSDYTKFSFDCLIEFIKLSKGKIDKQQVKSFLQKKNLSINELTELLNLVDYASGASAEDQEKQDSSLSRLSECLHNTLYGIFSPKKVLKTNVVPRIISKNYVLCDEEDFLWKIEKEKKLEKTSVKIPEDVTIVALGEYYAVGQSNEKEYTVYEYKNKEFKALSNPNEKYQNDYYCYGTHLNSDKIEKRIAIDKKFIIGVYKKGKEIQLRKDEFTGNMNENCFDRSSTLGRVNNIDENDIEKSITALAVTKKYNILALAISNHLYISHLGTGTTLYASDFKKNEKKNVELETDSAITALAFSEEQWSPNIEPEKEFLALGKEDGSIHILKISLPTETKEIEYKTYAYLDGHRDSITSLYFNNKDLLTSAGKDKEIKKWNIGQGTNTIREFIEKTKNIIQKKGDIDPSLVKWGRRVFNLTSPIIKNALIKDAKNQRKWGMPTYLDNVLGIHFWDRSANVLATFAAGIVIAAGLYYTLKPSRLKAGGLHE